MATSQNIWQDNISSLQQKIQSAQKLTQKAKILLNRIKEQKEKSSIGDIEDMIDA